MGGIDLFVSASLFALFSWPLPQRNGIVWQENQGERQGVCVWGGGGGGGAPEQVLTGRRREKPVMLTVSQMWEASWMARNPAEGLMALWPPTEEYRPTCSAFLVAGARRGVREVCCRCVLVLCLAREEEGLT